MENLGKLYKPEEGLRHITTNLKLSKYCLLKSLESNFLEDRQGKKLALCAPLVAALADLAL